jgi:hypothetical protein
LYFFGKKKKEETPTIYTVETCQNCGQAKRRIFEDNDYIYKRRSSCNNCSETVMITAIYGEYPPEKQKKKQKKT